MNRIEAAMKIVELKGMIEESEGAVREEYIKKIEHLREILRNSEYQLYEDNYVEEVVHYSNEEARNVIDRDYFGKSTDEWN